MNGGFNISCRCVVLKIAAGWVDCLNQNFKHKGFFLILPAVFLKDDWPDGCLSEDTTAANGAVFEVMPDGNEILIGHRVGVKCCFSFVCDFGLCPIVPDEMRAGSERAESGLVGY